MDERVDHCASSGECVAPCGNLSCEFGGFAFWLVVEVLIRVSGVAFLDEIPGLECDTPSCEFLAL